MKKIFFFTTVILFLLISCKKQYTCRCQTNVTYPNNTIGYYNSKSTRMTAKMNKKQAESVCKEEANSVESTYNNYITNNGNFPSPNFYAKTNCSL